MPKINQWRFLIFVLPCLFLINLCCKEKSSLEPNLPQFSAITDSIPFDKLGMGKLVFERIVPNSYEGLVVVDIDRRTSSILEGLFNGPSVSPDGKMIAYDAYASANTVYDVFVMNIDGTNAHDISFINGQERSPSWTPDSRQVVYYSEGSWNTSPLYRQSPAANPTDRVLIHDFRNDCPPPPCYIPQGPISVSPNGTYAYSGGHAILIIDFHNSQPRNILFSNQLLLYSPAWSPDGNSIACLSMLRDTNKAIVSIAVLLTSADGIKTDTLVTMSASGQTEYSGDNSYSLCWSPDGSKIAFTRPDGQYVGSHLYLVNKDGTGLVQITKAEGVTDRSLSWCR